jgi:hypothetical protein
MFYVSVIDGPRYGLLLGPFAEHDQAHVEAVRTKANELDPRAWFYAFGTCKAKGKEPGRLNDLFPEAPVEMTK